MPKVVFLLIVVCFQMLVQCTSAQEDSFPSNITTEKHIDLERVKGSRIFLKAPKEYQEMPGMPRLYKSDNQYLMVVESKGTSFTEIRPKLIREQMEAQGAKVDMHQHVVINGMEGFYFDGPSKKSGETKMGLAFGNDSTYIMVVGVCASSDATGKEELKDMMRSVFYDATFPLDPFEFANYEFDITLIGYEYATSVSNIVLYSPEGTVPNDPKGSFLSTMSMPGMTTDRALAFAEDLLRRSRAKGVTFDDAAVTRRSINGYDAHINTSTINLDGARGVYYQAVVTDGKSTVVLMAQTYDQQVDWLKKLERTVASIKLKAIQD